MEENFSMEWNMEWKWNGRKLPVWNMEKLSSIPCPGCKHRAAASFAFKQKRSLQLGV